MSARATRWTLMSSLLVAAALADLAHAVGANQREALREHAGRGIEIAEALDPFGGEAGLFLQLLDRGAFGRRVGIVVADQAGGKLDAAAPSGTRGWSIRITLPSNSARMTTALISSRAAGIFPFAAPQRANELARPHHFGRRQIVEVHSSISLSGISLVSVAERGKCSASTAPTRSIAAKMPSPGRPSLHLGQQRRHRLAPGVGRR